MRLPVMPPVKPMLAKAVAELPDEAVGDFQFEPKWDGFRCIVFRDGDEVVLGSRNEKPLTRYFPELVEPLLSQLPEQCVVDGELVIAAAGGLDFEALQQRIHPAESRINRLAAETPASFVAFDLLALADQSLLDVALRDRHRLIEAALGDLHAPLHLTPTTRDRAMAHDWFVRFEGAGLDGVMAKPLDGIYQPDKRVQLKVKHKRTADCVVAGYRVHKSGDGVGSLLLGLYDDEGSLHHVGVASSFSVKVRKELVDKLADYEENSLDDHPWRQWAEAGSEAREAGQRMPGGFSRWNVDNDLSFNPLRIALVAEVAYENVLSGRFRHGGRLVRWRDDRTPDSCTYGQLEQVAPYELAQIFTGELGRT
jgi:ATP-dependent DNA ligase